MHVVLAVTTVANKVSFGKYFFSLKQDKNVYHILFAPYLHIATSDNIHAKHKRKYDYYYFWYDLSYC